MAAHFTFYNRSEYFEELIHDAQIAGGGDRIVIATMTFDPRDSLVHILMHELCEAAKRGADIILAVDSHSFLINQETKVPGPLWYHPNVHTRMWQPFRRRKAALEALLESGGTYTVTNVPKKPFSIIPAGRSHMKFAVVNNKVFVGGCNLRKHTETDIMVNWQDQKAADWLFNTATLMHTTGSTKVAFKGKDQTFPLSTASTLLLDAGKPNQSVIYERVLELIDDAKEWLFITGQFFPGGRTGQHLHAAHRRGVKVHAVFSHPLTHGPAAPFMYAHGLRERSRLPAELFTGRTARRSPELHAKVLASENGAIVGSHNYITQGVTFGTAELALQVMDPAFSEEVTTFMKRRLDQASSNESSISKLT